MSSLNNPIIEKEILRFGYKLNELIITDYTPTHTELISLHNLASELYDLSLILGRKIEISRRSALRPKSYELSKGRSGNSEHSKFYIYNRGAADLVNITGLYDVLVLYSSFKRICLYPNNNFIHVDYKPAEHRLFNCESPHGLWKRAEYGQ